MSQDIQYFQNTLQVEENNVSAIALEQLSDGYLIAGNYYGTNNPLGIMLWKVDHQGQTKFQHVVAESNGMYGMLVAGQFNKLSETSFMIASSKDSILQNGDSASQIQVYMLDQLGNVVNNWTFGDSEKPINAPTAIKFLQDGSFFLLGYESHIGGTGRQWILRRISDMGQEMWKKNYLLDFGDAVPFGIYNYGPDEYLLAGSAYDPGFNYQSCLVKVDENGEEIWRRAFGGEDSDGSGIALGLEDGSIVFCHSAFGASQKQVYLLDSDGETISEVVDDCGYYDGGAQSPIIPLSENRIIFVGFCRSSLGETGQPVIYCLNKDAEILWAQEVTPSPSSDVYVRELEATDDGGFIICGFRNSPGLKYAWVAKFDSLGNTCWQANCDSLVTSTASGAVDDGRFSVYPNPASSSIRLSGYPGDLPMGAHFRIYDVAGALLQERALWGLSGHEFDVSQLPAGVYFCELALGKQVLFSEKLIVC